MERNFTHADVDAKQREATGAYESARRMTPTPMVRLSHEWEHFRQRTRAALATPTILPADQQRQIREAYAVAADAVEHFRAYGRHSYAELTALWTEDRDNVARIMNSPAPVPYTAPPPPSGAAIVSAFAKQGIALSNQRGKLVARPASALNDADRKFLAANRNTILAVLTTDSAEF